MNAKKVIIVISSIIAAVLIFFLIKSNFLFSDWSDGIIREGEESIKSSLGDEFILEYTTRDFPDYETSVRIMSMRGVKIVNYIIDSDFAKPDLKILVNNSDIRCYELDRCIIYRTNQEIFKGIKITHIKDAESTGNGDLVLVAKALFAKKEWKWIKVCGEFLLNAGDAEVKKTFERYATDQFTAEELDQNKNSEIKKEDMIDFAQKLLE